MPWAGVLAACKAAVAVLFVFGALLGVGVPFALERCNLGNRICYLNAFAGGAFLALGIMHIMPEAVSLLDELQVYIHLNGKPFSVAYLLTFLGYVIILFCEAVLSGESAGECEAPSGESRKGEKGSCTTKSTHSAEEPDLEGPIDPIEAGGTLELAPAGDGSRVAAKDRRSSTLSIINLKSGNQRQSLDSGAFFMMLALAIHGLFEGAIVGASSDISMVWIISTVILGHKWAEAMLLMCQILDRKLSLLTTCFLMGTFIASSPVGVLVGALLAADGKLASGICNALGAGTVLFIAGEISGSAFHGCGKRRFIQFLAFCSGAALVIGLTLLDVAYG